MFGVICTIGTGMGSAYIALQAQQSIAAFNPLNQAKQTIGDLLP
jgi:hypothetical protein